jgi:hypothetical protein
VLPCALLLTAAIVALGPPLGRLLFAPSPAGGFWLEYVRVRVVRPEPTEQARFVLALLGPLLVSGGVLALRGRRLGAATTVALMTLAQVALTAFAAVCLIAQQRHVYAPVYTQGDPAKTVYFTLATLAVAVALALLAAFALASRPLTARAAAAVRETPAKRLVAVVVAALYVALWLLSAFNTDRSLSAVNEAVAVNVPFWTDEAFAVLGGHAPLVDFNAQYGHLWAYLAAGGMTLLGTSFAAYAAIMLAGTAGALAAIWAVLRRFAGSSLAALAVFLPFVATSFFMEHGPPANRYGPAGLFSLFPIRYAGPLVLLWLVVRRLSGPSRRPPVLLFAFAGVVAVNNLEFGVPALGATLAALLWSGGRRSAGALARLGGAALAGIALAAAAVSLLTLLVAGVLPDFGLLLTFPRIYARGAFGLLPMPSIGLHLVVYVTFAAALVLATVRAAAQADAALTGALAWAGVFGLGAGAYFAGRSHPHVLIDLFSAWALALSLLLLAVVPAIPRRPSRRPQLAELLVLAGFGAMVCSLAQTPTPWSQIDRLQRDRPRIARIDGDVQRVVDRLTEHGEPVALLLKLGHRIAYRLGLDDVTPYANMDSMMTREQWDETLAALRSAHGTKLIAPRELLFPERIAYLERAGFEGRREAAGLGIVEYVAR